MALTSTEQQLYYAIAILTAVEERLFYGFFIKTPQLVDPLSEDPTILQPDEADGLGDLWLLVHDSATQLVESDLQRRWAEAVKLLMEVRDPRPLDDVLAEVIGGTGGHCSSDSFFFWHRFVHELRELAGSSDTNGRNE